ncbi:MAG: hypothetical protein KF810_21025 [Rhizobiaceae bacterium]|nr:hypothetical protein [Rhizobiaceae bacterium]
MADDTKPRAVSGDIMAGPAQSSATGREAARIEPSDDIVDADYISVPPASAGSQRITSSPPAGGASAAIGSSAAPAAGLEMLRRQDAGQPTGPVRGGPLFWTTGIALVIASFWVSGGHALVRELASVGTQASQGALRISGVTSRIDASGVRQLLLVDGEVANDGKATEHLPALEISVIGNDSVVTRYRLGTSGRPLSPGETFAFSSRLDAPKSGVKTVTVSFSE